MTEPLVFVWQSAILLVPFVQLLIIAALLFRSERNQKANRVLAVLLIVMAGAITPWMIGYASFYDRWDWLSHVPFETSLAIAPLLFTYIYVLVTGKMPGRIGWHFIPAALQVILQLSGAVLSLPVRRDLYFFTNIVIDLGILIGVVTYGWMALALLSRYRFALAATRSDDNIFALNWLKRCIFAAMMMLVVWAIFTVWNLFSPLGYGGLMYLNIAVAIFALYLGVAGWNQANRPFPSLETLESVAVQKPEQTERDWAAQGLQWQTQLQEEALFRDASLSVAKVARHLGSNENYVSRAFNDGLGKSFSDIINDIRSEAVAAHLNKDSDVNLLALAFDCGFNSKASFNRAFRRRYAMTPSAYRKSQVSYPENNRI